MKIIPIFIPHAGCLYKCIYCDQRRISGTARMPGVGEIQSIIERNIRTMPKKEVKEIAFFGGTFTFLSDSLQEAYLDAVNPYIKKGIVKNIRMSTHPEAVSLESMKRFKKKGGRLVELGIQSLDRDVLRKIKRKTDLASVKNAVRRIKKAGLKLGVQVMLGLPGDTLEKALYTARELIKLKPETARIYPTLVIRDTGLAKLYREGKYIPLDLEDAIEQSAKLAESFEEAGVKVIRIGLHPSEDLDSKASMLAGPYHSSFGEMVRSRQMRNKIIGLISDKYVANRSRLDIYASKNLFNLISGHKGAEKRFLERYFNVPIFFHEGDKKGFKVRDFRKDIAMIDPRMPREAKDKLKRLNYYIKEVPLHKKLSRPVRGHADMMLFKYGKKVIYEPTLEDVAELLRKNGYSCIEGDSISSSKYPKDIIYNACAVEKKIIRYKGKVERRIASLKTRHISVRQGYAKCSIVPVDEKHIITSDQNIKKVWEKNGGIALLVRPGHIKLPGYKAGFIGGATGVTRKTVFFVGSLKSHPDGTTIRDFVRDAGKNIIELCGGPLYDIGTLYLFEINSKVY